jgi:hypothetical protein
MNRQPLFPNRDPRGPSDPLMDQLLRETFQANVTARRRAISMSNPARVAQTENRTHRAAAQTPIPPLLKLYSIICAGLFLAVIQLGCESHQQAGFARIQTSLVQADTSSPPAEHPAGDLHSSPENRAQSWIREDEPAIEVSGPVFEDPFTDFAPRAVLERLPAPRAELVESPAPRAQLVAPSQ